MKTFMYDSLSGPGRYFSNPESFPSVGISGISYSRMGAPTVAPVRTIKCAYCGNMYPKEIQVRFHNCPTCAGGWCE